MKQDSGYKFCAMPYNGEKIITLINLMYSVLKPGRLPVRVQKTGLLETLSACIALVQIMLTWGNRSFRARDEGWLRQAVGASTMCGSNSKIYVQN